MKSAKALAKLVVMTGTIILNAVIASAAHAEAWRPNRPVTLVVPYAAGGGTDATARAVARSLSEVWGQPVVIENRPGADGLIGTNRVIEAKPDGYTLVLTVPSVTLAQYQEGHKGGDPLDALEPITALADTPPALVSTATVAALTLPELIAYCKTASTPCSFATGENSAKFVGKKFAAETGISNLIIVNYKGSSAIIPDLIAGRVTMSYTGLSTALAYHEKGTVRVLSTFGPSRSPSVPDVLTIREAGMPNFELMTWYGLFAPKGTPRDITQSIAAAVQRAGGDADVQKGLRLLGAVSVMNSPEEFAPQVKQAQAVYRDLANKYPVN